MRSPNLEGAGRNKFDLHANKRYINILFFPPNKSKPLVAVLNPRDPLEAVVKGLRINTRLVVVIHRLGKIPHVGLKLFSEFVFIARLFSEQ